MSEINGDQLSAPIILGAAGDIGRTAVQQLAGEGIFPAGIVLTPHRLQSLGGRIKTAEEIATNFAPDGEQTVLEGVELSAQALRIGDAEVPVVTPEGQHELLQEGHPVIDATGAYKKRELLEGLLDAGAGFVVVSSPIKDPSVPAIVYGVNGDDEKFDHASEERLLSTSSCTTTAVSSFLGPVLLGNSKVEISGVVANVMHARTKSNDPDVIDNNIIPSSSGATREIPKILGIKPEQVGFILECARANAACGSLANLTLLLSQESPIHEADALKHDIVSALGDSDSVYALDSEIRDTKGVIGRRESAVISLEDIKMQELPGGGSMATGIRVFYDNVSGYTRSLLDSYRAMAARLDQVG